jgi:hypothetical protein
VDRDTKISRHKSDINFAESISQKEGQLRNYGGVDEIKFTSKEDWHKFKKMSRSLHEDDFEMLEQFNSSSDSDSHESDEDDDRFNTAKGSLEEIKEELEELPKVD